jgi:hypothetical protein
MLICPYPPVSEDEFFYVDRRNLFFIFVTCTWDHSFLFATNGSANWGSLQKTLTGLSHECVQIVGQASKSKRTNETLQSSLLKLFIEKTLATGSILGGHSCNARSKHKIFNFADILASSLRPHQVQLTFPLITRCKKMAILKFCYNKLGCSGKDITTLQVGLGCCGVCLSLRHRQPPSKKHTFLTVQVHTGSFSRSYKRSLSFCV